MLIDILVEHAGYVQTVQLQLVHLKIGYFTAGSHMCRHCIDFGFIPQLLATVITVLAGDPRIGPFCKQLLWIIGCGVLVLNFGSTPLRVESGNASS